MYILHILTVQSQHFDGYVTVYNESGFSSNSEDAGTIRLDSGC